jgi:hypothetical protein
MSMRLLHSSPIWTCMTGVLHAETYPELEDDDNVQTQWKTFKTEQHKRRRCYIRSIL